MKCKYCNNELQEGQSFCNSCGNKVEADLNVVDQTTMGTDGIMNYDFDFSDQIINNTPKKTNNIEKQEPNIVNEIPIATQDIASNEVATTENKNVEVSTEPDIVNVSNQEESTAEPITVVDVNKPVEINTQVNDTERKTYCVLDKEDLARKSNSLPIYLFGIILVVLGGYFFYKNAIVYEPKTENKPNNDQINTEEKEESKEEENSEGTKEEENSEGTKEEEKESNFESSGSVTVPTTEVSYSGLVFKIPNDLLYTFLDDYLVIYPQDESWSAAISLGAGSFQQMKANKDQAKLLLEQQGVTVYKYGLSYYGGTEWLNFEAELQGEKSLIGYASAPQTQCFVVVVSTDNNSYDYTAYKKIAPIIQSAR